MIVFASPVRESVNNDFSGFGMGNSLCEFFKAKLAGDGSIINPGVGWTKSRITGGISFICTLTVVHCSNIIIDGVTYVWYDPTIGP